MTTKVQLPKNPGSGGWAALLGEPPPAHRLQEVRTADWLVIGAGFAGLAAARRLAHLRGADRIVLLEAARVGDGPAGRNSGFMVDLPHDISTDDYGGSAAGDRIQMAQNRTAIAFAGEAAEDYGLTTEAFDRCGKINGAASDKGLANNAAYARHLDTLGERYEVLDEAAMRSLTGSPHYRGGLYTPGTVQLQPALFVRGLARGLAARVAVYEESPVIRLARVGADWQATTPDGAVTAPRVILAVNGHAERFGYFTGRLVHVFTYASMTRALAPEEVRALGGAPRWGVTPSDPMGTSVRRIAGTGGDRIVVRNRFTYDPSMAVPEGRLARVARSHDASFRARFPMLNGVEMAYRWGGRLCLSLNGVPAFGQVDEGVFAACCQNALGTTKGTLAGLCAADLAAQGNSPHVAELLAAEAPRRLPPAPLAWIGANATLRWREWRARGEL